MNIHLTPELEALIQSKVVTGHYTSNSEVVREALRQMEDRDQLRELKIEALRRDIAIGIEQSDRGEGMNFDQAAVKDIINRGRERKAARKDKQDSGDAR